MPERVHNSHPLVQIAAKLATIALVVSLSGGAGLGQVLESAFGPGAPTCCCLRMGRHCHCPHCKVHEALAHRKHSIVEEGRCAGDRLPSMTASQERVLPSPLMSRATLTERVLPQNGPLSLASRLGGPPPHPPPQADRPAFA